MDYGVSLEINNNKAAGRIGNSLTAVENDKSREGLAYLTPGKRITGTVVSVDKQVTLDFDGHRVTTSKELMKNAAIGDRKTFEVIKATCTEIELKLLEGSLEVLRQTIKAISVKEKDLEAVLAQKKQATKQTEKEKAVREAIDKLEEISTKFTEQDYIALEEEGFAAEAMPIQGLYIAIDRVKKGSKGAQSWKGILGDTASVTKVFDAQLKARLKEENLPVSKQNLDRIKKTLTLSDTITKMDDRAMKYLILRDEEPTIDNIYKAYYSGSSRYPEARTELTATQWKELEGQVEEVLRSSGYEVNTENMADARWLLENELPLNEKTFRYRKELEDIKANTDTNMVLDRIFEGMKNGTAPGDIPLASQNIPDLEQSITKVHSIGKEAVAYAIKEKLTLNIKNLAAVQEDINTGRLTLKSAEPEDAKVPEVNAPKFQNERIEQGRELQDKDYEYRENSPDHQEYEEVKAQRQLEEIRLRMSLEAASRLEKKGIHVETERLEKVVEELKRLEDSYYKRLLSEAEAADTPEAIQLLRSTTEGVEQLKYLPAAVLGATLIERRTQTIPDLISSGAKLITDYAKSGTAYETLATVPNAQYGDSILKAFSNISSLLAELNLEDTQANQRAVRILGYNRMDITKEAIDQAKAYDMEVTTLIKNLHPAVTVRMIKEGLDPLSMPIGELNTAIDRMKEEQGITSEDKFSNYLHKLERENGISPQERNAYIGIYRLLYNVEKSDGAALGALLKANQEVTLSHLLTAVQTGRRGSVSAVINDEFGMLTEVERDRESIADQLKGFLHTPEEIQEDSTTEEEQREATRDYLNRVVKQLTEEISPAKLKDMQPSEAMTAVSQAGPMTTSSVVNADDGPWDSIKNIPIEKLLEQLQKLPEKEESAGDQYTQKVLEIRELCKNSEQSLRFLNDFQMAGSPQNIMIANQILSNGVSPIVRLMKKQNENNSENKENKLKDLNEISDTLIDKSSMNEVYNNLETQAKEALTRECSSEIIDSNRLSELRAIGRQLTFLKNMASKEFYQIPIETKNGITNMNLTILRGSETTGKVSVTVWSKELGDIKAELSLKEYMLKGYIVCDNRNGLQRLQAKAEEIEKAAKTSNLNLKQLDFAIIGKESDNYIYQNPQELGHSSSKDYSTERALYRLAKAIIQTVRLAENNEEAT